jgi:hypothetical protein
VWLIEMTLLRGVIAFSKALTISRTLAGGAPTGTVTSLMP